MVTREEEEARQKKRRRKAIIELYKKRLGSLRKGMDLSKKGKLKDALESYIEYLNILSQFHEIPEKSLSPRHFDHKKETTELLLISQVYWDMAKIYDKNPNLYKESVRCLNQFAKFTVGFKYHFVNSEMLRKYIKSKGCNNMDAFKKVYMEIREKSGACYVSSYCFSDFHPVTIDLRRFRMVLKSNPTGQKFVDFYYAVSPVVVSFCQRYPIFGFFFKAITSPILRVCAYLARWPFL
jgi:hypothetical protein